MKLARSTAGRAARLATACALAVLACGAGAQSYPKGPIRMIVPFPPGGSNDIIGRMVGAQLTERLGRQVVIDNRGGAGGVVGTEIAANSNPDGHTLLLISVAYAFGPALYKLPYDPVKAFLPITQLGTGPNALVVFPGLPVKTTKELIAMAKDKPGQINFATAGVGSFQHLGSELFRLMAGINIVHVPFKGGGPGTLSLIAGNTQMSLGSLIQVLPHIRTNRLRLLATGGAKRAAAAPDAPTIAESGIPGYEANNWWGLMAPAGTPKAVIDRLYKEVSEILQSPETTKRFQAEGAEAVKVTSAEFGKLIVTETAKWGKVARDAGIKGDGS